MSGRTAHAPTAAIDDRPGPRLRLAMFRDMLRIRLIEERIAKLYPEQEIRCPTHLCIGQEAPPVGVSAHLQRTDMVFTGHRSHGHYLAKGGNLKSMLAELYGKVTGCALGKGGSQHLIDLDIGFMGSAPILASTISVGVGAAWGQRMRGVKDMVTVIYFGDGAIEEGAFHESLNYAALQKLPIVFVCENNLYSVHTPLADRQPAGRSIADLARSHGIVTVSGDGNDVEEVWRLGRTAVTGARHGSGPHFMELLTYRHREHVGPNPDLDLKYRSSEEFAIWQARDPVETYKRRLTAEATLGSAELAGMEREIEAEIDAAVHFAKSSPFPPVEMLWQHVYPGARS
jgi:TPP-dependent pyruvate/acetoin dehydrogenase alpha subunit